ncbi:response regulator transcription factor [Soonwooa sp.]|uniref:response regulator transcription factor n=1 Tax=Soonwooa sp. TaxID=1938592 RepID=UPI00289EA1EB|nr:response regulator transcription factor [Soonwooa sp.]
MEKFRIAIVDDDYLIVSLLKSFLEQDLQLDVVFETTDGYQLLQHLEAGAEIDVLLLDLKMKTIDGLEVLRHIKVKNFDLKIIVISSHYQDNSVGFMVKEGVSAFIPKGMSPFDLVNVIKQVAVTGFYFKPDQVEALRDQISSRSPKPILESDESISDREIEIIRQLCQQRTAKEIGETLFISQKTVEGHKSRLFAKIGVKNVTGLVVYALQKNIVKLEELPLQ